MNDNGDYIGYSGGSGGYAEYILKKASSILFNNPNPEIKRKQRKNQDFIELWIEINGKKELHFALAYGFRNI